MSLQEMVLGLIDSYGLLGVFLAAVIANATIFLPIPMDIAIFAIAGLSTSLVFIVAVGIVAGIGAGIGESVAYALGLLGISTAERFSGRKITGIEEIQFKLSEKGMLFVFLAAMTPFPFDIIGIIAGIVRYNWAKFFIAVVLGRAIRYEIVAFAGFFGVEMVKKLFAIG